MWAIKDEEKKQKLAELEAQIETYSKLSAAQQAAWSGMDIPTLKRITGNLKRQLAGDAPTARTAYHLSRQKNPPESENG